MAAAILTDPLEVKCEVPSLRSNFKWMFAGNACYAACQWAMLSLLTKAGNPTIVGQFALGLAVSAPIFMFTNMYLRGVQATDARSEFEFADYFTLRVLSSFVGLILVLATALIVKLDSTTRLTVSLLGCGKAVESLGDAMAGLLQKRERIHQVAISLTLRGLLSIFAFGITFIRTRSIVLASIALVLAWLAVLAFYDFWRARDAMNKKEHFFGFRPSNLRSLLMLSMPLGIIMTLFSLNSNIPRYILAKYRGEAELGIFASLAYVLAGFYLLINALGESASARLARAIAHKDMAQFWRVMEKLIWMGIVAALTGPFICIIAGRPILTILYRSEYAVHSYTFAILVLAGGLTAIGYFLGYGLNATRQFRLQLPVTIAVILTTSWITLGCAARLGLTGVAIALLASAIVHVLGNAVALKFALGRIG